MMPFTKGEAPVFVAGLVVLMSLIFSAVHEREKNRVALASPTSIEDLPHRFMVTEKPERIADTPFFLVKVRRLSDDTHFTALTPEPDLKSGDDRIVVQSLQYPHNKVQKDQVIYMVTLRPAHR